MKIREIFCLALLLLCCLLRGAAAMSSQLQAFHKAFDEAKLELESIRNSFGLDDEELLRQRRRTIDELLSSFQHDIDLADEVELGDDWYRKYSTGSSKDCKGNRCGDDWKQATHDLKKRVNFNEDNEISKLNLKYKGTSNKETVLPISNPTETLGSSDKFRSILDKIEENNNRIGTIIQSAGLADGPLAKSGISPPADDSEKNEQSELASSKDTKDASLNYDAFDMRKSKDKFDNFDFSKQDLELYKKRDINPNELSYAQLIKSISLPSLANDQLDETKNDLSHEANYKLSKLEQDASEKKKEIKWKGKVQDLVKRNINFNPMNEIKLKTSFRLMDRGFGPSLPSNSLTESRRMMKIDDILKRMEKNNEPEITTKDELEKLDSLLSVDENNVNILKTRFKRLRDMSDQQLGDLNVALEEAEGGENEAADRSDGNRCERQYARVKRISDTRDCVQQKSTDKKVDSKEETNKREDIKENAEINEEFKTESEKKNPPREVDDATANEKTRREDESEKPKRRVKRINSLSDLSVDNIDFENIALASGDQAQARPKRSVTLRRHKRFATTEDDILPKSTDFDTLEMNEDEMRARMKRATLAEAATPQNATAAAGVSVNVSSAAVELTTAAFNKKQHKLNKRSAHLQDEVEDNNSDSHKLVGALIKTGVGDLAARVVVKADGGGDMTTRKERLEQPSFNFDNAVRTLGLERFDNMKPKALMNVDGMKFDNLYNVDTPKVKHTNNTNSNSAHNNNNNNNGNQNVPEYQKNRASEYVSVKNKLINDATKNHETSNDNHKSKNNNNNKYNDNKNYNDNNNKMDLHTARIIVDNLGTLTDSSKRDSDNENNNNNSNISSSSNSDNTINNNKNINNNNNNNNNNNDSSNSNSNNNNNIGNDSNNNNSNNNKNTDNSNNNNNNNNNNDNKDNSKKLMLALRDEILNCTAFTKLESYLRDSDGTARNNRTNTPNTSNSEKIGMDISSNPTESSTTAPQASNSSTFGKADNDVSSGKKDDMMKLNITINASVMGDQKSSNFIGNGTINVRSNSNDQRERRGIVFPDFDDVEKRTCEDDKEGCASDKKLDNMVSGKLSTDVVNSLFGMVRQNDKLKVLWPALENNRPAQQQSDCLGDTRNLKNNAKAKSTERLLQRAMATINDIIEQQVRERTCVPLRPDLSTFYEQILTTYKEQQAGREKRENSFIQPNDFSKEVRAIDPTKIDEKSRIVKKLLKQYEDLPQEDQQQVSTMRDDLLMDLMYLRKLKDSHDLMLERRKRQVVQEQQLNVGDSDMVKQLEAEYTPAFLKLLKTSEIFREAANEKDQA